MKTVELFAGTRSFSLVAKSLGHDTFTTDYERIDGQDLVADIHDLTAGDFPYQPDMLWASPPCEGFSVAAIGSNWGGGSCGYWPKSNSACRSLDLVNHALRMIVQLKPTWWFIENPRGLLRKLKIIPQGGVTRHTVTYCQYGDTRMKPTDIWTNATWWSPRPVCRNGAPCHEAAPRGSKTGTQGVQGYKNRSRIPAALFEEILTQYRNR
jgi:hypothetical protein